jgi:uncharacterized protein (DUF2126 family)
MEIRAEKNFVADAMYYNAPPVAIMHTYNVSATKQERTYILNNLDPQHTAMLSENDSDICYFIIPASAQEIFLAAVSVSNTSFKKVSISELREKYSNNPNYALAGNSKLISFLFSIS